MTARCSQGKFKKTVKIALVQSDLTITALAKQLGFARNTVSMAINNQVFPTVRRRIVDHLKLEILP